MTFLNDKHGPRYLGLTFGRGLRLIAACALGLSVAACKHGDEGTRVAGWTLVDPSQRHPILVSQKPETMQVRISRGSQGLNPQGRARVLEFADRFRAADAGNSRLVIGAPTGSANEVDAMAAVDEVRELLSSRGFSDASISIEPYPAGNDANAPLRVSYMSYVAEGPQCGHWGENLAREPENLPYANFGCATQRNFAAQIANPADLLGPRTMTPRPTDRRAFTWDKFVKGESTGANKSQDERVQVKGAN